MDLLLCRDPSVPPPPHRACPRCRRPVHRVILGPCPSPPGPAYEPADMDTVTAMMAPPAHEPADADTIRRMAGLDPGMPAG